MRRPDRYAVLDRIDEARTFVFVPAIMSVGLFFSLASVARDAAKRRGIEALARRGAVAGHASARIVVEGEPARAEMAQLRSRRFYALTTVALTTLALYVAIGSIANYFRTGDYVAFYAWMLLISLLGPALLLFGAVVTAITWYTWPRPPAWTRRLLASTPLAAPVIEHPRVSLRPRTVLQLATLVIISALFVVLSIVLAVRPTALAGFDQGVADLLDGFPTAFWDNGPIRLLGTTHVAVILAGVIGLATVRCRPFALLYVGAIFGGLGASNLSKFLVARARPIFGIDADFAGEMLSGISDSFPSGHVVQATLIAGLLPTALWLLTSRRPVALATAPLLYAALAGTALSRIAVRSHWPTDIVGGLLLGVLIVVLVHFALGNRALHEGCENCLWTEESS